MIGEEGWGWGQPCITKQASIHLSSSWVAREEKGWGGEEEEEAAEEGKKEEGQ